MQTAQTNSCAVLSSPNDGMTRRALLWPSIFLSGSQDSGFRHSTGLPRSDNEVTCYKVASNILQVCYISPKAPKLLIINHRINPVSKFHYLLGNCSLHDFFDDSLRVVFFRIFFSAQGTIQRFNAASPLSRRDLAAAASCWQSKSYPASATPPRPRPYYRGLTYPTLGKGKSSSKCHFWGIC